MEVVGEYEFGLLGLLGSGAFAAVFKGRHRENTDCIVAVKKIKKAVLPDLSSKEIKILKELTQLHHENVVNLLDCMDGPEFVYLIMEYCDGGTLADYMQARGVLSETTIALFFSQIVGAMKALHSKGIVHRDLKPHNILLCNSGASQPLPKDIIVKIADFGFARFLQGGVMAGTICGSPLYMAPEILVSGRYDAKADLWSIAVIVYQCLVGRPPFPASSVVQLQKLYEHNPDMQPLIPPNTSSELSNLLINLLKIKPRKRMEFDVFFNHPFFKIDNKTVCIDRSKSNVSLASVSSDVNILSSSPLRYVPVIHKTPEKKHHPHRPKQLSSDKSDTGRGVHVKRVVENKGIKQRDVIRDSPSKTPCDSRPQSPDLDDFVIVPDYLPCPDDDDVLMKVPSEQFTDVDSIQSGTCGSYSSLDRKSMSPANLSPCVVKRSSTSPIAVPKSNIKPGPVRPMSMPCELYTMKSNRHRTAQNKAKEDNNSPPISRTMSMASVESMSPPAVQFLMGTPPSHHGSQWGSLQSRMACSPCSATPCSYEMRAMNCAESPRSAVTHPTMQGPVSLVPPELDESTLMPREHNEVMLKLEFTRDLSNSLIQLARWRSSPLTESLADDATTMSTTGSKVFVSERQRNIEQLLLYVRALELLRSALSYARTALNAGQLHPSSVTRQVLQEMNSEYQQCLLVCKYLSKGQPISELSSVTSKAVTTTDKLIYSCAIEMCQSAVMDELLGEMNECSRQYQMAYLLLHSLAQQASSVEDRKLLNKYKDGVEKRLMNLFSHGFINAKFATS